jgi:hypothetical protein
MSGRKLAIPFGVAPPAEERLFRDQFISRKFTEILLSYRSEMTGVQMRAYMDLWNKTHPETEKWHRDYELEHGRAPYDYMHGPNRKDLEMEIIAVTAEDLIAAGYSKEYADARTGEIRYADERLVRCGEKIQAGDIWMIGSGVAGRHTANKMAGMATSEMYTPFYRKIEAAPAVPGAPAKISVTYHEFRESGFSDVYAIKHSVSAYRYADEYLIPDGAQLRIGDRYCHGHGIDIGAEATRPQDSDVKMSKYLVPHFRKLTTRNEAGHRQFKIEAPPKGFATVEVTFEKPDPYALHRMKLALQFGKLATTSDPERAALSHISNEWTSGGTCPPSTIKDPYREAPTRSPEPVQEQWGEEF